jgi:hypothetical protein
MISLPAIATPSGRSVWQDLDRPFMRSKHIRQSSISLRRFIHVAAA